MFGLGFDPEGEMGPLGNVQSAVAAALNGNANGNHVYIAAGPTEPVFQAPNPQYALSDLVRSIARLFRRS